MFNTAHEKTGPQHVKSDARTPMWRVGTTRSNWWRSDEFICGHHKDRETFRSTLILGEKLTHRNLGLFDRRKSCVRCETTGGGGAKIGRAISVCSQWSANERTRHRWERAKCCATVALIGLKFTEARCVTHVTLQLLLIGFTPLRHSSD